jgi:hypothetical protein
VIKTCRDCRWIGPFQNCKAAIKGLLIDKDGKPYRPGEIVTVKPRRAEKCNTFEKDEYGYRKA